MRLNAERGRLDRTLTGAELELAEAQRQIQMLEVQPLATLCLPSPGPGPHLPPPPPALGGSAKPSQEMLTAQPAQAPQPA